MARTAQEVYSLFGLKSPAQVRAERNEQFAQMLKGQSGAGRAGAGVGAMLGGLFRGEDPEAQRYLDFQDITKGQNLNDPNQLRAMAAGLENVSGFGEQALSMRMLADTIEKEQMGETINAPVQVGTKPIYKQEFNDVGMPTGKYIEVGREPIYRDVPHRRTKDGLVPLLDFNQQTAEGDAPVPDAPVPDYITNEQGVVVPNPAKTAGASAETTTEAQEQVVTSNVSPEAADRITQQSGQSRTARTGETGVGIAPPPKIQGEVTYVNPQVLGERITALESQLSGMSRTSKGRKDLQKQIAKLKQQQRKFSSRSSGGQNRRNK